MNIRDVYSASAIALVQNEVASNKIAYLGAGLFPARKKMGLDLKWLKTSKGLPVSLAPSNFDAVSTLRSREGFSMDETEMPFFRESMLVKEKDEQEIMRVQESADPYAADVLKRIFDDANTLIDGANVVPERMIMQLLAPSDGSPKISIVANGVTYAYNYDPDSTYKARYRSTGTVLRGLRMRGRICMEQTFYNLLLLSHPALIFQARYNVSDRPSSLFFLFFRIFRPLPPLTFIRPVIRMNKYHRPCSVRAIVDDLHLA